MDISKIRKWRHLDRVLRVFPPSLSRVVRSYLELCEEIHKQPLGFVARLLFLIVVLLGAYQLVSYRPLSVEIISSAITAISILAGFLATLILFTGSREGVEDLDHHTAERVVKSLFLLLGFQLRVFFRYLFTIAIGLTWFFLLGHSVRVIVETLFVTGLIYSLLLSLLLPLQLYELHSFRLKEVIKKKKKQAQQNWLSRKQTLGHGGVQ